MAQPMNPVLAVENLARRYSGGIIHRRKPITAFEAVSFCLDSGRTLAVVGESGSGKTSLALCLAGLERPTYGTIWLEGHDLTAMNTSELRTVLPRTQLVFQDPANSLNPRWTVLQIVAEGLRVQGWTKKDSSEKSIAALEQVALSSDFCSRRPHQLSGGQRQRVAIARALVLQPKLLILDEVLSSLDGSVQAQICNLLLELQTSHHLSYVFITHDISMAAHMADEIAVMYRGKIVEHGPVADVLHAPHSEVTLALLSATPTLRRVVPAPQAP